MSEYQYYEFQAIDHALTPEEMDELRGYSTRAEITPTRFCNEYNWGDLNGDPRKWMERWFDAFLYVANWGTHWFMLRLPRKLLDWREVSEYLLEDGIEGWQTSEHVVISWTSETEEPDWEQGSGWLASQVGVRASLMRGDYRSLYLGWLAEAAAGRLEDDFREPPVPPGLAELDAAHRSLADFLRIPVDLITAAAETSAPLQSIDIGPAEVARWVADRSGAEKDAWLTSLILNDRSHSLAALRQRIERELNPAAGAGSCERRTVAELQESANALRGKRKSREAAERAAKEAREAAAAAKRRQVYLASLRGRDKELWHQVDNLAGLRNAAAYKEAVERLLDLRDLAMEAGSDADFMERLQGFRLEHGSKSALMRRLDEARLTG